jgi:hypothetical protein
MSAGPARQIAVPPEARALLATFVEHQNPIARALWAAIEPLHRRVVPAVLGRGARG